MKIKKKFIIVIILSTFYIVLLPLLAFVFRPPRAKIEGEKELKIGYIKTQSKVIEIHIMIGDVFVPQKTRRDIGFDIVPISCYFDPIELPNGELLLLTNPLLNSAILHSARNSAEFLYLLINIINALEQSKQVVSCFMLNNQKGEPCEGDQIVPYVWVVYNDSIMRAQGVKYLAALPLFDPTIITGKYSPAEVRKRLRNNVEAAVRRLISYCSEKLGTTVKTIGLAALGATSHKGGDSEYFLEFSESFLAMLRAIRTSYPPPSLDRIYFVAFEKHKGVFREDAIRGLQKIGEFMVVNMLLSSYGWSPVAFICYLFLLAISLLSFQNLKQAMGRGSRWKFLGTISSIIALIISVLMGSSAALFSFLDILKFRLIYLWYVFISSFSILEIMWLNKRI